MISPNHPRPLALQLLRASAKGHLHDVMDLLHRGATLAVNKHGRTPLHISAHRGYLDIVRTLLSAGCNPDIQDDNGDTALHRAVSTGNIHVVQSLLNEMCSVDRQNKLGDTALHEASRKGLYPIVRSLVKANANDQLKNNNGDLPLHMASAHGRASTVQFLLSLYQNDSVANSQLDTPLHLAVRFGHTSCVKLLLSEVKSGKNAQNKFGNTALHIASLTQNLEITRILLNSKASHDICNKEGKTAVQIAKDLQNGELVIMLISGPRPKSSHRGRKIKKETLTKNRPHSVPRKQTRPQDKLQSSDKAEQSTQKLLKNNNKITLDEHYKQLNFNPYVVPQLYSLYRDKEGEIKQQPVIEHIPTSTHEIVNELHKAINETKQQLLSSMNQKNALLIKQIHDLECQLAYQFNCLDKLNKERVSAEQILCLHRINQRATEERKISEQFVNQQLRGWVATKQGGEITKQLNSQPVQYPMLLQTADSENKSVDSGVGGSNWHHNDVPIPLQHSEAIRYTPYRDNGFSPCTYNDLHGMNPSPYLVRHKTSYDSELFYQQSKRDYQNCSKSRHIRSPVTKLSYPTAEEELLVKYLKDEMTSHDFEGSPADIALIDRLRDISLAETHSV